MPAVLQIEAGFQVVAALLPAPARWQIAAVAFPRALVVDDDGATIRIAGCARAMMLAAWWVRLGDRLALRRSEADRCAARGRSRTRALATPVWAPRSG
jgi:hypothetical protein